MSDDLRPKERAVLLALLMHGPTLSNSRLYEIARVKLDGKEAARLNDLGLLESDLPKSRPHVHTLTPAGSKWCLDDLAAGNPRAGDSALERAFYSVLAVVRGKVDFHSLFGMGHQPQAEKKPAPAPKSESMSEAEIEAAVRAAYKKLRREPGAWVSLADLRDRLGSVPRKDVDAALKRLNRLPGVVLVPESDQTSLTDRRRDAALKLGGQPQHLIKIEGA